MRARTLSPERKAQLEAFQQKATRLNTDELLESYRRAAVQEVVCGIETKSDSENALAILGGEIRARLQAAER